ncbi:MAG TPA: radical SAM protein [Methyloprofundus sp.]|uniref:B12-binding domain-containing radical SAM protein n=1 Tax=Methyloprofundus sp. TaxID=2020875 RepID=UPI0018532764|nr:radical SAM protein [Methyloprofundus sp.]HIG65968.1 radical SAM protein [Methyloprofundus sp.]HIL78165.1 radical SAM protein [Methylococcales bacterium]
MKVLLITPPMTQLNTPYPATAYLTGFLKLHGYEVAQRDLAIDLILNILSRQGLEPLFEKIEENYADIDDQDLPDSIYHFLAHYADYYQCIDAVINFLQGKDPSLALRIASRRFLPEGPQFETLYQMEENNSEVLTQAFGLLGVQDKAKYLATLFINDIAAVIKEGVDAHFEISRYAERLAASNPQFDDLYNALHSTESLYTETIIAQFMQQYIDAEKPDVLGISVPFPGNMLGALQAAKYCKQYAPHIKIVLGGGFVNTELRALKEPRLFETIDYVCLDDGERPLLTLLENLQGKNSTLFRTYLLEAGQVIFKTTTDLHDIAQKNVGTPDYMGLPIDRYLSLCEMLNPMHRIWSDGRWNKITIAHGCYWAKCSFCDISLDYIANYDDAGADITVQRIKTLVAETGQTGFHFVDEAAPPKALFALAKKLIEQDIVITWWGNIRFEKTFTAEKCQLLADSGCIAISGGLEVASDRLLALMQKGVSVAQVAKITKAFADAGILVHAYLMYGFPSQTEQETVDALEYVRQLMQHGCIQSAYWHRFAATIHSPVGLNPAEFGVELIANKNVLFAENDIAYIDSVLTNHEMLGLGLKKALYNYMHNTGFEYPASFWFANKVPESCIAEDYIEGCLY